MNRRKKAKGACECSDPGCPRCHGSCKKWATTTAYRIDMDDETGTLMCDDCAADAFEAGVFRSEDDVPDEPLERDRQGRFKPRRH